MKHLLIAPAPITPARPTLLMIAALVPALAALAAGCGGGERSGATVVQELRGDTVVMISSGEPERVRIDAVDVLWRSDEFVGIAATMARAGDHLVIGDQRRIHVVSIESSGSHTVGQQGDGPGEFQMIHSVNGFGTDRMAAYDYRKRTLSLFSTEGELLTTYGMTFPPPFFQPQGYPWGGAPPVEFGGGVLWVWGGWAEGDNVNKNSLIWLDPEADTLAVLETWDSQELTMSPRGFLMDRDVFSNLVTHAVAPDGRVATGYPADYCIQLFRVFEEGVRTGCRERSRIPVEAGFAVLPPDLHPALQVDWEWRNPVDLLPHFDRLLFSESGDLWVRLYHEEFAHVHPLFIQNSEFSPTIREWEVFDAEAVLVRHVTLPGAFDLQVILDDMGFGFFTLDTGEVVVGRVDLTGSAEPPT